MLDDKQIARRIVDTYEGRRQQRERVVTEQIGRLLVNEGGMSTNAATALIGHLDVWLQIKLDLKAEEDRK